MRATIVLVFLVVLSVACSTSDSGVEGYVTAGPDCPVERLGYLCPDKPYGATLSILRENGQTRVTRVTTDTAGYYKVHLAPGSYTIRPESAGALPRADDLLVVVLPHKFTQQDFVYDTGIR